MTIRSTANGIYGKLRSALADGGLTDMAFDAFVSYSHAADGLLAPSLQRAMQRLAKPWYRPRALRVFRDDSALSANPHLWSSIQTALDESEWFVLLASPEAVASEWVDRELRHWLTTKSPDRILAVVTDGTWQWDATAHALIGTAVPPALRETFDDEPRHLDLRWARSETDLDIRNSRFRDSVAQLAAPVHGIAKDELESEDIRLHRRARRLARGGVSVLVLLLVISVVFGVVAGVEYSRGVKQQRLTEHERIASVAQNLLSESKDATTAGETDRGVLLAAEADRFAVRSGGLVPSAEIQSSLVDALQANPSLQTYLNGLKGVIENVAVSPDGRLAAAVSESGQVGVWRLDNDRLLTTFAGHQGAFDVTFTDKHTLVVGGPQMVADYRSSDGGTSWRKEWVKAFPAYLVSEILGAHSHLFVYGGQVNVSQVDVFDADGHESATIPIVSQGEPIAVSPDGTLLAAPGDTYPPNPSETNTVIDLYNVAGAQIKQFSIPGYSFAPLMGFSADSHVLGILAGSFQASSSLALHLLDVTTGSDQTVAVPTDQSWNPIAMSPTLGTVVESDLLRDHLGVGAVGGSQLIGDLDAPGNPSVLPQFPASATFVPSGGRFLAAGGSGVIPIFAVSGTYSHFGTTTLEQGSDETTALAPDGSLVVSAGSTMRVTPLMRSTKPVEVNLGTNAVTALAFGKSPDVIALAYDNGSVELRSTVNGKRLFRSGPCLPINPGCNFPPNVSFSGTLAAGRLAETDGTTTRIWGFVRGTVVERQIVGAGALVGVHLSTTGARLVTITRSVGSFASYAPIIRVYVATSHGWSDRRSITGISDNDQGSFEFQQCPCVAVDGSDTRAVETSSSGLTMWNLSTGRRLWNDAESEGPLWFSSDGRFIYHATLANDIDVISASDGTLQTTLQPVDSADLGPISIVNVGKRLLVMSCVGQPLGCDSLELSRWTIDTPQFVAAACREANRNMTVSEWLRYVGRFDKYERTCPRIIGP